MYLENFIQRMILRKDFQRNQTSEKQTENRMGNHTVIIKKRYNAIYRRSSKKEHRADALALRAEERRDKLRKAMGRSKYPLIHGSLNGETRLDRLQSSMRQSITHGREPGELKHLSSRRKRKQHVISKVAASEMERGQTGVRACRGSDRGIDSVSLMERFWESLPKRVKAPYMKDELTWRYPEYHETRETLWEHAGTTP